jgi:hypothetical protein
MRKDGHFQSHCRWKTGGLSRARAEECHFRRIQVSVFVDDLHASLLQRADKRLPLLAQAEPVLSAQVVRVELVVCPFLY